MGIFTPTSKKTDAELVAQHNESIEHINNPKAGALNTIIDVGVGASTAFLTHINEKTLVNAAKESSFLVKGAKAITSVPGAIAVGAAAFATSHLLSLFTDRFSSKHELNDVNQELQNRHGKNFGLEPITAEDLARMKEANGQAMGAHSTKAISQTQAYVGAQR